MSKASEKVFRLELGDFQTARSREDALHLLRTTKLRGTFLRYDGWHNPVELAKSGDWIGFAVRYRTKGIWHIHYYTTMEVLEGIIQ